MSINWMSECVEAACERWLASSFACCAPKLLAEKAGPQGSERSMLICHEQPRLVSPPRYLSDDMRSDSVNSSRPSLWLAEGRDFASRVSSRTSFSTRRRSSRRPTIGGPSEFRRIESPSRCIEKFRPLQLSIYLPGNELSPLPSFNEDLNHEPVDLEFPAQVLVKPRPASILSRPSTAFTIPRKPVGSLRNPSTDNSRYSIDSHYTLPSINYTSRTPSTSFKPNATISQSTQDFLNSLDTKLPRPPPPLLIRSGSEPFFTLHRRASDQNLRLRTHLEERLEIEKRLNEFDTIVEEKQIETESEPAPTPIRVSSIFTKDLAIDEDPFLTTHPLPLPMTKPRPSHSMTSPSPIPNPQHPLQISPPLLLSSPPLQPAPPKALSRVQPIDLEPSRDTKLLPPIPTSVSVSTTRSHFSQWLLPSSPTPLPALARLVVDRANAAADVDVDVDVAASPPPLVRHRSSSISSADSAGGTAVLHTPWLSVGGTHPCWVGKAGLGNGEEEEGGWKMGFRVRGGNERGFEQEIGVGIGVVKDGGGGGVEVREVEVQVEMGVGMAF